MEVTFWGVRGSIPVPGRSTIRYGGNTSCVSVRDGKTLVILDAGSGIRGLGAALMAEADRPMVAHLFITHTHWDHIQGFPFFAPAYVPGNQIFVYGPQVLRSSLLSALEGQMEMTFFPISLDSIGAVLEVKELEMGSVVTLDQDILVSATSLTHPGIPLGYRIDSPRGSVAYITDWEPLARYSATDPASGAMPPSSCPPEVEPADDGTHVTIRHEETQAGSVRWDDGVVQFCNGVDIGIYDSQYDRDEYQQKRGWGHACIDDVVDIGLQAEVKKLVLFHHDPMHDDARIDRMVSHCRRRVRSAHRRMPVMAAREGQTLNTWSQQIISPGPGCEGSKTSGERPENYPR